MNNERIKSNLNSVLNHVREDRMPQELKDDEIIRLVTEALNQLEQNEKEHRELKNIAFELANRL